MIPPKLFQFCEKWERERERLACYLYVSSASGNTCAIFTVERGDGLVQRKTTSWPQVVFSVMK